MDPRRFDALTKSLSPTGTRRALLRRLAAVSLAGVLAVFLGRETTQADGSGAIVGGGGRRRHRGKPNHHHTRDNDKKPCAKPCGPCARCNDGKCKAKRDGSVCRGDGVCARGTCKKGEPTPATCPGLNQTCTTDPGTQCCPDVDPNVVCVGTFYARPVRVCQNCNQEPTPAGEMCVAPPKAPGHQCCGGNEDCFVGMRVDGGQLACFINAACNAIGDEDEPCMTDDDCMNAPNTVCIKNELNSPCCAAGSPATTLCAQPCPA
jgi:hypothetical protein